MKKLLTILIVVITLLIAGVSCTKTDSKPACETNQTGSVKITNNFPGVITVDVWTGNYMGERVLGIGQSYTYTNVPAGAIEIWEEDAYTAWGYWNRTCTACETLSVTISASAKNINNDNNVLNALTSETKLKGNRK